MERLECGPLEFYDKIPVKRDLELAGIRVVPPGVVRFGAFLEPGAVLMPAYVNIGEWEKLPKSYQAILTAACAEAESWMVGKYDTDNVAALRRLIANGTQLRPFSREILDACYKAAQEFYAETSAKNEKFKKVYEPWKKFLEEEHQWFRVQEQNFDNYMLSKKQT